MKVDTQMMLDARNGFVEEAWQKEVNDQAAIQQHYARHERYIISSAGPRE